MIHPLPQGWHYFSGANGLDHHIIVRDDEQVYIRESAAGLDPAVGKFIAAESGTWRCFTPDGGVSSLKDALEMVASGRFAGDCDVGRQASSRNR